MKNNKNDYQIESFMAIAMFHSFDYLKNQFFLQAGKCAYHIKAEYRGSTPVLFKKGRWYSPTFWFSHIVCLLLCFFVLPLMFVWHELQATRKELKGCYSKATEPWEKAFVEENAKPPVDFQI